MNVAEQNDQYGDRARDLQARQLVATYGVFIDTVDGAS